MFCANCGKEIDNTNKLCPFCGVELKKTKKNNSGKWIAIGCLSPFIMLFLMIIIPSIIGANVSDNSEKTTPKKSETPQEVVKPKLELLKKYSCRLSSYGGGAVCGVIINNSDRNMSYVQVEINLYDRNGNQVGSTLANVNNLAPNAKWEFKAPVLEDNVDSYKIVDINGF